VAVSTSCAKEIFVRCAPALVPENELDFKAQAKRFYRCLPRLLDEFGAGVEHVVLERVFFEDFAKDMDDFRQIRRDAYARAGIDEGLLPATTYIRQPPCRLAQKLELQIYAILPNSPESASVRTFIDHEESTTAKLVEMGGFRHLYVADINGYAGNRHGEISFREQSDAMFARARKMLSRHGANFPDVLRTWCYITDIDNNYAEFNLSRNAFFQQEGVTRLPASTGIEAGLYPPGTLCAMDLYALLNPEGATIEVMHTPTLNEAADYGSSFSRGMKIDFPEKTVLHVSGTASVNEEGATVHVDDIRRQLGRMLLNVRELLEPHGAKFEDVTQIATFLKSAGDLDLYQEVLKEWGIPSVPNTFVEAGVCRPDLLCELEAIAILPKQQNATKQDCDCCCEDAGPPEPRPSTRLTG